MDTNRENDFVSMNIQSLLKDFFTSIDPQYMYNEASVRFELGWFLRSKLPKSIILENDYSFSWVSIKDNLYYTTIQPIGPTASGLKNVASLL